jgi:pyruvate dehydrogenase E1 component
MMTSVTDDELTAALRNLGGHDLGDLLEAFHQARATTDGRRSSSPTPSRRGACRPLGIRAITLRCSRPTSGGASASPLGADPDRPWARFGADSAAGQACAQTAARLRRPERPTEPPPQPPAELRGGHRGRVSAQQALGRFLLDVARSAPEVAARIVNVSPDVASSTNLGGWINRVGIWNMDDRTDWFVDDAETLLHWHESPAGQHIELGIAETNLVGLLAELGVTSSRDSQPLLPIGTVYDPFVARALEPWSFGIYSGGQSILIGTPSGVTLAPEGGAHQSVITPSIGLEQPGCVAWEPAFAQDLEWALLDALGQLGRPGGRAAYFRLSTRPVDQALAAIPEDDDARRQRRELVLAGGYRLHEAAGRPAVTLAGMGAIMPEVLVAAAELERQGVGVDVLCLTSPDLVFRALQARHGLQPGARGILDGLLPPERAAPIVSVLDGHPHTLSSLAAVNATSQACLGVTDFGQVGELDDLYRHFGIDSATIVGAAWDLLDAG